jgi:hypothetical protein
VRAHPPATRCRGTKRTNKIKLHSTSVWATSVVGITPSCVGQNAAVMEYQ